MKIIGTGSALPKRSVDNNELSTFLETSDEWIFTRTGISSRRVLTDETMEDLTACAAQKALAQANLTAADVDYIICSTTYSPFITPALATVVQGIIQAQCPSIDINGACAGFIYALELANGLLQSGKNNILIVCAESNTRMTDWTDRSTCVLFGDAAAAAIVTKSEDTMLIRTNTVSNLSPLCAYNASGNSPFAVPYPSDHLYMAGQEVYKFAVTASIADIAALLEETGLQQQDIDYFILHQANNRIVEAVRQRLEVEPERFPNNIRHLGNTTSASVLLLLDELSREGKLKTGDKIIMSTFGAGMVTGACLMHWTCI